MKKLFGLCLTAVLLIAAFCLLSQPTYAAEIVDSGTCGDQGDNLTWTLDSEGTLTISGTGRMYQWQATSYIPWQQYNIREQVRNLVIEEGVTSISRAAFDHCESMTTVAISESVTEIGEYAFSYCQSLTSVTIPEGVTSIGGSAFKGCIALKSITIPKSVTKIVDAVFYDCGLTSVTIHEGVTSIGNAAFAQCRQLTSIVIPGSVISIGDSAFAGCYSMTSLTIQNGVKSIGNSAFGSCSSLASVRIPSSVVTIGAGAFAGCDGLYVDPDNQNYSSDSNGVLFNKSKTTLIAVPNNVRVSSYTIPQGVTAIGDGAFVGCVFMRSVTIPDSVTSIGRSAFYGCGSIKSIIIPNSVRSIGAYAFAYCMQLTSINIPDNITAIEEYTFYRCDILTSLTLPNGLLSIGAHAFDQASKLQSINIPDSVTSIGGSAFAHTRVRSITIPKSMTSIGYGAFMYSGVATVIIHDKVTDIGDMVFMSCARLTNIVIPDSVTTIGTRAFWNCTALKSITIPEGVTQINGGTFDGCKALTSVTIPSGMTLIGSSAFDNCHALWHVLFKGTEIQWKAINFGMRNELLNVICHYNCTGNEIRNLELKQCYVCHNHTCQHDHYEFDENNHWSVCDWDAVISEAVAHTYEGDTCFCGYVKPCSHDHYIITDETHLSICSCGQPIGEAVAHTYKLGVCVCGAEQFVGDMVEENGKLWWYVDGEKTYGGLMIIDGNYYYARTSGEIVRNRVYGITKTNDLLPALTYTFGPDGKMIDPPVVDPDAEPKNGIVEESGMLWWYVDGQPTYGGLMYIDGYYYYARTSGEIVRNRAYGITKTNDLLPARKYTFGPDGKMLNPPAQNPEPKNGIVEEDGKLWWYVDGVRTYGGLMYMDGYYYYARTSGEIVTGRTYGITKTNDLLPARNYIFGADGKMLNPPVQNPEPKNGIVEEDGKLWWYVDGVRTYGGLMYIDGYYYYARTSGEIVTGRAYGITKTNDLLPARNYTFDENGRMINPPVEE